jgi:hypothetical protein
MMSNDIPLTSDTLGEATASQPKTQGFVSAISGCLQDVLCSEISYSLPTVHVIDVSA